MATYKVLQDIEAEDKFLGPLTLKQFIFASVAFVCAYLSFFLISKSMWLLVMPFLPVILVTGFLAWPWGRDQPTEIWLLAKIRFFFKPRRRIWDQTGIQELVTITAPKAIADQFVSDNLSQTEVKSRLRALADTIDSRGWAVKNVNVNLSAQTSASYDSVAGTSDRLIDLASFATEVPNTDVRADDDILDETSNPTAQHLSQMVKDSTKTHRQQMMQRLKDISSQSAQDDSAAAASPTPATPDYWFMNAAAGDTKPLPGMAAFAATTVAPSTDDNHTAKAPLTGQEKALLDKIHHDKQEKPAAYGHTKVIEPYHPGAKSSGKKAQASMTHTPDPAILELAGNNDLNVATLARQANKKHGDEPAEGEVVVSLR